MVVANIEPITYNEFIINKIMFEVVYYDLNGSACTLRYKLIDNNGWAQYVDIWNVEPFEIIQNWGSDDSVILDAFANTHGYVITSIE